MTNTRRERERTPEPPAEPTPGAFGDIAEMSHTEVIKLLHELTKQLRKTRSYHYTYYAGRRTEHIEDYTQECYRRALLAEDKAIDLGEQLAAGIEKELNLLAQLAQREAAAR